MRQLVLFLAFLLLVIPAHADQTDDNAQLVFSCISNKGIAKAGDEHPAACVGLLRDPCIAKLAVPGDADMMDCTGAETEAWDRLLNNVYGEARQTQLTKDFEVLRDRQSAWLKNRDKVCALPDGFGTLERLQGFGCYLNETSARALVLYEELGIFKR
jgi:uncharacterized protein YecT (DUF1311 family)